MWIYILFIEKFQIMLIGILRQIKNAVSAKSSGDVDWTLLVL